jgi:hypothetical protein
VSCLPLLDCRCSAVIVGIRPSTRNTRRHCSARTRSGAAAPRRRQPTISGDENERRVIARARRTAVHRCAGRALWPLQRPVSAPRRPERSSPNLGHAVVRAKRGRASSSPVGDDWRSTTPSRTKLRRGAIPSSMAAAAGVAGASRRRIWVVVDRHDLAWTNNETPAAINRGCSAQGGSSAAQKLASQLSDIENRVKQMEDHTADVRHKSGP